MTSRPAPDWSPFQIDSVNLFAPRPLQTRAGIGDRLRTAAFAEVQAEEAFLWAAEFFSDAAPELKSCWRALALQERKHRDWLINRMNELEISLIERPVSDVLWTSLVSCKSAREFCHYMADAEERGRRAGERFHDSLKSSDPKTAAVFGQIALEERAHIEAAFRFFPK